MKGRTLGGEGKRRARGERILFQSAKREEEGVVLSLNKKTQVRTQHQRNIQERRQMKPEASNQESVRSSSGRWKGHPHAIQ